MLSIPDLLNQSGVPDRDEEPLPFFDPKKYEELLATAVLNKASVNYMAFIVLFKFLKQY